VYEDASEDILSPYKFVVIDQWPGRARRGVEIAKWFVSIELEK
jgi:hypothetical protein